MQYPYIPNGRTQILPGDRMPFVRPITIRAPQALDDMQSKVLEKVLLNGNVYETPDSKDKRDRALGVIRNVVEKWGCELGRGEGGGGGQGEYARIEIYGSCRLGVQCPESDIDAVVISTRNIGHNEFFGSLHRMLKETKSIQLINALPRAFAPIIKMVVCGVNVDLSLAQLPFNTLPRNWHPLDGEESYISFVEYKSLLALGGIRNADLLVRLVPNETTFRLFLRAIRHWARQRGVYSNALGYFGGISWAILAGYFCMRFPNGDVSMLVKAFFSHMGQYPWPKPIVLCPIEHRPLRFPVWNPNRFRPGTQSAVITPAYPAMNSSHNMSCSALNVLRTELKRAQVVVSKLNAEQDPSKVEHTWSSLLSPRRFFREFGSFLMVTAAADDPQTQFVWSGLLEAKLRILTSWIEGTVGVDCSLWPLPYRLPNPKEIFGKDKSSPGTGAICDAYFFGLKILPGIRVELEDTLVNFVHMMNNGKVQSPHDPTAGISARQLKRKQLPKCVLLPHNSPSQPLSTPPTSQPNHNTKDTPSGPSSRTRFGTLGSRVSDPLPQKSSSQPLTTPPISQQNHNPKDPPSSRNPLPGSTRLRPAGPRVNPAGAGRGPRVAERAMKQASEERHRALVFRQKHKDGKGKGGTSQVDTTHQGAGMTNHSVSHSEGHPQEDIAKKSFKTAQVQVQKPKNVKQSKTNSKHTHHHHNHHQPQRAHYRKKYVKKSVQPHTPKPFHTNSYPYSNPKTPEVKTQVTRPHGVHPVSQKPSKQQRQKPRSKPPRQYQRAHSRHLDENQPPRHLGSKTCAVLTPAPPSPPPSVLSTAATSSPMAMSVSCTPSRTPLGPRGSSGRKGRNSNINMDDIGEFPPLGRMSAGKSHSGRGRHRARGHGHGQGPPSTGRKWVRRSKRRSSDVMSIDSNRDANLSSSSQSSVSVSHTPSRKRDALEDRSNTKRIRSGKKNRVPTAVPEEGNEEAD